MVQGKISHDFNIKSHDLYRTSTVILVDREGVVTFTEKTMMDPIIVDDPQWNKTTVTFNI